MRTIWKYHLPTDAISVIQMPVGAEVIHADVDDFNARDSLVVWAAVDDKAPTEDRMFAVCATGEGLPQLPTRYVATCRMCHGVVAHVFEVAESI